jgi:hypothetical protein
MSVGIVSRIAIGSAMLGVGRTKVHLADVDVGPWFPSHHRPALGMLMTVETGAHWPQISLSPRDENVSTLA